MTELNYSLFFDENHLPVLRKRFLEDPLFADFREALEEFDKTAERHFLETELDTNDQLFHIGRVGETVEKMAFLYLMTGDGEAAALAADSVRAILQFKYWDFFLEGDEVMGVQRAPSSTVAIALAADWLGETLDPEERKEWIRAMGIHGCEPCYRGLYGIARPHKVKGWRINADTSFFNHRPGNFTSMLRRPEITQTTNLRAVPASALAFGAVAYEADFGPGPDVERWRRESLLHLRAFRTIFEEDGSYHEAVNYGNYTAKHLLQAVLLLRRRGVEDLSDLINWGGFSRFLLNMSLPSDVNPNGIINFGDSGSFPPTNGGDAVARQTRQALTMIPFFAAAENNDSLSQWIGKHLPAAQDTWSLLCYDPDIEEANPESTPHLWICDLDWVVAREGWRSRDLVLAMRSGPPGNHEHADRNSILLKAFGEPLITDPSRPPYSYTDPAWLMRTTEGHSAVLVDGEGHSYVNGLEGTNASYAKAKVLTHSCENGMATWVSDATHAYRLVNLDIRKVVRSVAVFFEERAVLLVDRLEKYRNGSTLELRFFGYNNDDALSLSADDHEFWITRPGAFLRGNVYSNASVAGRKDHLDIPQEQARQHPFVAYTTGAADAVTVVTLLIAGRTQDAPVAARCTRDGDCFHLTFGEREMRIDGATIELVG